MNEEVVSKDMEKQVENVEPDNIELKNKGKQPPKNKFKEEIDNLKNENADLKDKLLRTVAEMENIRKRTEKQVEDAAKYAVSNLAKNLLSVLDNLQRASENIPNEEVEKNKYLKIIKDGLEMTSKEFANIFERFQIKKIHPEVGSNFDHNLHQAVAHIPSEGHASGTIVNVMQTGYIIHDRLLRPAMVAVAK